MNEKKEKKKKLSSIHTQKRNVNYFNLQMFCFIEMAEIVSLYIVLHKIMLFLLTLLRTILENKVKITTKKSVLYFMMNLRIVKSILSISMETDNIF